MPSHFDIRSFMQVDVENHKIYFKAPEDMFINGDILIRFYNQSTLNSLIYWNLLTHNLKATFKETIMFRFAWNTAFIEEKDGKLQ